MASSRRRAIPRASSRPATLAHAISSTRPVAAASIRSAGRKGRPRSSRNEFTRVSSATSHGSRKDGQSGAAKVDYITRSGKYIGDDAGEVLGAWAGHLPSWTGGNPRVLFAAADEYERANARLFTQVLFALPNDQDPVYRISVIGLKSPATNLPSPAPGERVSGREKQARNPGRCEPAGQNSSRPNPTSAGGSTARYSRPRRPPGRNLRALRPEDAAHRRRTGLCRSRLSPAGRLSERTAGTSKSLPPPRYDGFNVRDQTAQRSQRLSDIAVAPRPRQPDVADAERVAQVEQRHLNRSAATSTPAEHVLDLSVGFRPLPQTTRSRVSCRAPGRRHPAGAGTARASGPSRTIRPGRAGTFKMYQDRLPVGRSWCARCGAHQADKLALDNTPVCARCWLPTDEQAANSPPTSSEGINLRLPTAAHLRRGKP